MKRNVSTLISVLGLAFIGLSGCSDDNSSSDQKSNTDATVIITTFDMQNRIIEGTFSAKLSNGNEEIVITDGAFKVSDAPFSNGAGHFFNFKKNGETVRWEQARFWKSSDEFEVYAGPNQQDDEDFEFRLKLSEGSITPGEYTDKDKVNDMHYYEYDLQNYNE